MSDLRWPGSAVGSLLAGLTAWVALWAWSGFVEKQSGFLIPALGACLITAITGMLLRSARLHALLVLVGQLVVLLVWFNRTWAAGPMLGGLLPTPTSLERLGQRLAAGVQVSQSYAAPVPESAPQIYAMLALAGAVTAVLVDFLACGLRRVPLAGLPLLAVYTAPLSIIDEGVPWWTFVAGAIAFLFLLSADEARRLSGWGRQLSGTSEMFDSLSARVDTASVRASARKIGFTATGLAVVVPILIPTLGTDLFGDDGPGAGGAGDAVAISNPIVDLKRDLTRGQDVDLVEITTGEADPSYLRISVLDLFDGTTWKPSGRDIPIAQRAGGPLPRPPGLGGGVPRSSVAYTIEATDEFESRWLPTPYPVSSIDVDGDWRYDVSTLDLVSAADGQTTAGLEYSLEALDVRPTAKGLASAGPVAEELYTRYTTLPGSVPESVRTKARRIADSRATRFEQAIRLQEWFRSEGGFRYSLDRKPGNSSKDLVRFLGNGPGSRVGYCEQFAAAMALMGRAIGIPSRVAVGFLRPTKMDTGRYVYSAHDLHSWPEMYFEGTGWIRFEPTPAQRASTIPGYTDQSSSDGTAGQGAQAQNPREELDRFQQQQAATRPQVPASQQPDTGGSGSDLVLWPFLLLLVIALAVPRLAREAVRRRRWASATTPVQQAEAAWRELRDSAIDLRVPWDDAVTLRTRARSLVAFFGEPGTSAEERLAGVAATGPGANPAATAALERLVRFVERARYARSVEPAPTDLAHDVALCVQALRDRVTASRRVLATWLPVSVARNLSAELEERARSRAGGEPISEPGVDHAV